MNDIGLMEYINSQLEICEEINAETGRFRFEKKEWMISITVTRKGL